MKDDLFERLRTVDPATDERIVREARSLGDVPGRIAASEAASVRRFPRAVRRKATLAAVAAVVVVAIAIPLALLRQLGQGGRPAVDDSGDWVTVGTLADIRAQGVVYDQEVRAFLVATAGVRPLAFSAAAGDRSGVDGNRAIYCEPSDRFLDPAGDVFDGTGAHLVGPGFVDPAGDAHARTSGLDRLAVRVSDGLVQVDPSAVTLAGAGDPASGFAEPVGFGCQTANGVSLEGEPGFAIPNGTELPPIAVALPQSGMVVRSPVLITGSANVFEATVSIRVLDASGDVLAEAFTTATCGTGCRGDFSTEVAFRIDAAQPGMVQAFESSAKDGSMTNAVEIPVTLLPGPAAADPSPARS